MARFEHVLRTVGVTWLLVGAALRPAGAARVQLAQPDVALFPQVQLYVYAAGEHDQPIPGLRVTDLEVREGDRVVPVESFLDASRGTPIEVCLTIDRSGSMFAQGKLQSAQAAAAVFLRALRAEDRAALVSFADHPTLDRSLTRDPEDVAAAVSRLDSPFGGTAVYDGVYWSINQVALVPKAHGSVMTRPARPRARRVVLALTDGNDNRSRFAPRQVIDFARANGVTVYTIGLGTDVEGVALEQLARATGGRYFAAPAPQALAQLYAQIAHQLQSEYALTYRTPNPAADGTRRQVTVTLRAPAGTLAATTWYQAPGAGSAAITLARPAAPGGPVSTLTRPPARKGGVPRMLWLLLPVLLAATAAAYLLRQGRDRPRADPDPPPDSAGNEMAGRAVTQGRALHVAATAAATADRTVIHTNPRLDLRPLWVRSPVTEVGRAAENDLVIDSPRVSRRHARIELTNGEYRLIDAGSANGTFLNGERVTEAPISIGDVIRFADQEFRFAGEGDI